MKTTHSLIALTFALFSCSNPSHSQQTEKHYKEISTVELDDLAKVGNPIFLDVRTPEEFNGGAIPNAKHINYYGSDFDKKINQLDKSKTYIVYCKSGMRSKKTAQLMIDSGFNNIYNLLGGYDAWKP